MSLSFEHFIESPPGQRLLQWESHCLDRLVMNCFGPMALQVGHPEIPALRENRMQSRFVTTTSNESASRLAEDKSLLGVLAAPEALPFEDEVAQLVVLPHTLDMAESPHHAIREAVRVLEPEGRLVLTAFNPLSLWWARQQMVSWGASPYLPSKARPLALYRLKDWLTLLGMDIDVGHFGVYAPPLARHQHFKRWQWMDKAGDRWWPHAANLIVLSAVKRRPGPKAVGRFTFQFPETLLGPRPQMGMPQQDGNDLASRHTSETTHS